MGATTLALSEPQQSGRPDRAWWNTLNRIKAVRGYKASRRIAGRSSVLAANRVQQQLTVVRASQVRVTDMTYIRTWQGWRYLRWLSTSSPVT